MLLRVFKGTGPLVILLIIITLLGVWISPILKPANDSVSYLATGPMPLYSLLSFLTGKVQYLGLIVSFLMVSLMAYLLVNFNTTVLFINERTFLPAVIYILFGGLFPQYQNLNPVLPASIFLIVAFGRIMDSYRKQGVIYNFFDAGILIGTGSLFYANLIWFGLLVLIGIALLRSGNLIEITTSVIGLVTPYVITFGFYYVMGKDLRVLASLIEQNLIGKSMTYEFSRLTIATLITFGLIVVVSIGYLFRLLNTKKIRSRQTFMLLIWGFLISIGVYFLVPSSSVEMVWIISIPVSYFLTHYFVFVRKRLVPEIFFSVLFVLVLLIQIWYLR
jgi:hypothetical protein